MFNPLGSFHPWLGAPGFGVTQQPSTGQSGFQLDRMGVCGSPGQFPSHWEGEEDVGVEAGKALMDGGQATVVAKRWSSLPTDRKPKREKC